MIDIALKDLLNELVEKYNSTDFIEDDPISIPHKFTSRDDIEISGFLSATIAWGNRKSIIKNANRIMEIMGYEPHKFIMDSTYKEKREVVDFVHRTFNGQDLSYFFRAISYIYATEGGIGRLFECEYSKHEDIRPAISYFRDVFFTPSHEDRTEKHLASIARGSACKKINMYLRWMVRKDDRGVDFGIWDAIPNSALYLPLDVHSGNVGRELGLIQRKQNDWKTVEEVTLRLREFDIQDPIKYDYALFGAGVNKNLLK